MNMISKELFIHEICQKIVVCLHFYFFPW